MSKRDEYRNAARECMRIAELTNDPKLREVLRQHAQEWLKLAYAEQGGQLQNVLADFNSEQLIPRGAVHRQAEQQQQSSAKPKK